MLRTMETALRTNLSVRSDNDEVTRLGARQMLASSIDVGLISAQRLSRQWQADVMRTDQMRP